MIPLIVLFIVFFLIAVRQIGSMKLQIWQIMLGGAAVIIATGSIAPADALHAINTDVMLFLFGMFIVGQALEESGYLSHLTYKMFKRAVCSDHLVLLVLFGMGLSSAFLMNDTLAIIGTPVVLLLARNHHLPPKLLLLALAFAVTIGSAMSPIGNPQNLLIALDGNVQNPFLTFFSSLFFPTVINLFLAYFLLKLFYRTHFHQQPLTHSQEPIKDHTLAQLAKMSLAVLICGIGGKIILFFWGIGFNLVMIALISALPIMTHPRRWHILKRIDWPTLIFFAAMFVVMESVWQTGFFQSFVLGREITSLPMIMLVSIFLSQLISNVPLVALYLPMLLHAGASVPEMLALAASSTIAGNLLILGAASNIIIIQNAERKGETITFIEFAQIGVPLTVVNAFVYWVFLV